MKRFLIITILLACIQAIDAQTTTLVLRNSKEYVGRITMQRPGIDLVFFDEKNDEEINLKWSEIASIRTSLRNSSATEGLNDELTLLSGSVLTGQITEQSMDGTITLYLDNKESGTQFCKNTLGAAAIHQYSDDQKRFHLRWTHHRTTLWQNPLRTISGAAQNKRI